LNTSFGTHRILTLTEQPNKLNPATNVVMLQCKTTHNKKSIFLNEAGLIAEKPNQASFATRMHFIVQIKTMSISREI
jgi:hypothetical protein